MSDVLGTVWPALVVIGLALLVCTASYALFGGTPGRPKSERSTPLRLLAATLVTLSVLYLGWAAYLGVFATEGEVPPARRDPDLPAGTHTVGEETSCGSGGCWRVLTLAPSEGQSPAELAAELDATRPHHEWWRWYDPHSVWVSTRIDGQNLSVWVSYWNYVPD